MLRSSILLELLGYMSTFIIDSRLSRKLHAHLAVLVARIVFAHCICNVHAYWTCYLICGNQSQISIQSDCKSSGIAMFILFGAFSGMSETGVLLCLHDKCESELGKVIKIKLNGIERRLGIWKIKKIRFVGQCMRVIKIRSYKDILIPSSLPL